MKTGQRNTFSVAFYVRKERKTKEGLLPIKCNITLNGDKTVFTVQMKIHEKLWDFGNGKPKSNNSEAIELNQKLEEIKACIFNHYHDFTISGKPFNVTEVKNRFLGVVEETEIDPRDKYSLSMLFDYHQEKEKHILRPGTIRHYNSSRNYFFAFIKDEFNKDDIKLKDIKYQFLVDFEAYIYKCNNDKFSRMSCGNNTIMKHITRLRKLINLAIKNEWLDKDPFTKWQAKYTPTNRSFLSQDELTAIETYDFQKSPRLQKIKDLFIFSCYTGLSYVDVFDLTPKNIEFGIDRELWISTFRQKTSTAVKVPILPTAKNIIYKYNPNLDFHSNERLFPVISNQKINAYLKEIANICGIQKELTFHVARHTFATTITLTNGVPIESVSKMLGHTSIKTTQIYAKVVDSKISDDMKMLKAILYSQKNNNKDTVLKASSF